MFTYKFVIPIKNTLEFVIKVWSLLEENPDYFLSVVGFWNNWIYTTNEKVIVSIPFVGCRPHFFIVTRQPLTFNEYREIKNICRRLVAHVQLIDLSVVSGE